MVDVTRRSRDEAGRFANEHAEAGDVTLGTPVPPEPTAWMKVQAAHLAVLSNLDTQTVFAVAAEVPDSQPRTAAEAANLQKWCDVTGCAPGQLMFIASQMQAAEGLGPASPAAVLAMATGTPADPTKQNLPACPTTTVEIVIDDDDAEQMLDDAGRDDIDLSGYREVYADVNLFGKEEGDFYGVTGDGKEHLLALEVNMGRRMDLDDGYLMFRAGSEDPRPAHRQAQKEWLERRQDAAETLISAMGVSVAKERSYEYMLTNEAGGRLQMHVDYYNIGKLVETVNWRQASEKDIEAFLGGPASQEAVKTFTFAAGITARAVQD